MLCSLELYPKRRKYILYSKNYVAGKYLEKRYMVSLVPEGNRITYCPLLSVNKFQAGSTEKVIRNVNVQLSLNFVTAFHPLTNNVSTSMSVSPEYQFYHYTYIR
jgi:hypothetical protein